MLRTSHGAPGHDARGRGGKAGDARNAKDAADRPARSPRPAPAGARARSSSAAGAPSRRGGAGASGAGGAAAERRREEGEGEGEGGARLKKTTATRVPGATSTASDESREVAILVAVAGIEKKASGLEVIDVAGRVDYADFLVLMSGRSDRHVTALASAIEDTLRKRNKRALAVEGLPHANWVLMDFGDVVVHVFQDDARAAYDIDSLWMDARRVPVPLPESN